MYGLGEMGAVGEVAPTHPDLDKRQAASRVFAATPELVAPSLHPDDVAGHLLAALGRRPAMAKTKLVSRADASGASTIAMAQARDFRLPPPIHLNGRPSCFPEACGPRGMSGSFELAEIRNGYFATCRGMPLVFDSSKRLLGDRSSNFWPLVDLCGDDVVSWLNDAPTVSGPAIILADDVWDTNFCHWLLDWLPRLALMGSTVRAGPLTLIVNALDARFQTESLAMLGVDETRVLALPARTAVRVERMIVPSNLGAIFHPALKSSRWATDYLRSSFLHGSGRAPLRVYLSRGDAARRRVLNDDELFERLSRLGFEKVVLSELTFAEQAHVLSRAECVTGLHGAGFSHTVFMPEGGKVIEIFPSTYGTMSFYVLCAGRGVDYYTFVEHAVSEASWTQADDVLVDVDGFVECVAAVLQPS